MPNRLEDYTRFAKRIIEQISKAEDGKEILKMLRTKDELFKDVEEVRFCYEFTAAQLAVACHAWEVSCDENRIDNDEIERAFLKAVMDSFQSKESLQFASDFSFYHQRAGYEEEDDSVGVVKVFYKRLAFTKSLETEEARKKNAEGFQALVSSLEGFKTSFSNGFEGFVQSLIIP